MLKLQNISTYYDKIQAIKNVDITVKQGTVVTILGANGAGKTTTMNTIAGLLKPKEGSIHYLGENVTGLRPDQLLRKGLALVPEGRGILSSMTVMDNLEMGAYHRNDSEVGADLGKGDEAIPDFERKKNAIRRNALRWSAANAGHRAGHHVQTEAAVAG